MKDLKDIFTSVKYEPRAELATRVWDRVLSRMNRGRTARLWAFSATGMLSLVVLVPAVASLLGDFAKSGFYDYFSLLFSGAGVGSYWKDFVASLADSLPTANIIYTLALSLVFALSIKYALRQAAPEWLTNARHAH